MTKTTKSRCRFLALSFLLAAVVQSSGCSVFDNACQNVAYSSGANDFMVGCRNKIWAQRAFNECSDELNCGTHEGAFRDGFMDGYCGVCEGTSGCVPAVPPREYWSWQHRSTEGRAKANAWFEGYPAGVRKAQEQGMAAMNQIQVADFVVPDYTGTALPPVITSDSAPTDDRAVMYNGIPLQDAPEAPVPVSNSRTNSSDGGTAADSDEDEDMEKDETENSAEPEKEAAEKASEAKKQPKAISVPKPPQPTTSDAGDDLPPIVEPDDDETDAFLRGTEQPFQFGSNSTAAAPASAYDQPVRPTALVQPAPTPMSASVAAGTPRIKATTTTAGFVGAPSSQAVRQAGVIETPHYGEAPATVMSKGVFRAPTGTTRQTSEQVIPTTARPTRYSGLPMPLSQGSFQLTR